MQGPLKYIFPMIFIGLILMFFLQIIICLKHDKKHQFYMFEILKVLSYLYICNYCFVFLFLSPLWYFVIFCRYMAVGDLCFNLFHGTIWKHHVIGKVLKAVQWSYNECFSHYTSEGFRFRKCFKNVASNITLTCLDVLINQMICFKNGLQPQ